MIRDLTDTYIIDKVVQDQAYSIRLRRRYENCLLWCPTIPEKKKIEEYWNEVLFRELGEEIDKKIRESLDMDYIELESPETLEEFGLKYGLLTHNR